MKVIIELSEKEVKILEEQINLKIEDEYDAEYSIHVLLDVLKDN